MNKTELQRLNKKFIKSQNLVAYESYAALVATLINVIEAPNGLFFTPYVSQSDLDSTIYIDVSNSLGLNLVISIQVTTEYCGIVVTDTDVYETIINMTIPIRMREIFIQVFDDILRMKPK